MYGKSTMMQITNGMFQKVFLRPKPSSQIQQNNLPGLKNTQKTWFWSTYQLRNSEPYRLMGGQKNNRPQLFTDILQVEL